MFPSSPSLLIPTVLLAFGSILTLGFELIWFVFAATLVASMLVAVHRSIPRMEL